MKTTSRILAGLAFLGIALSVLGGGHWFLAKRLVLDPGLEGAARAFGLGVIGLGLASLFAAPISERVLAPPWNRLVTWPASLWMGFGFLFLVVLGASDLLRFLAGGVAWAAGGELPDPVAAARAQAAGATLLVGAAGALAMFSALRPPKLVRIEVPLARWPAALDGFRIAQLSDVHIGPVRDRAFTRHLVERVNALDVDLVCVTGDLVDGSARLLADEVAPLGGLRARHGAYFVTGNHDHYSGADAWVGVVEKLGLIALRNRHVVLAPHPPAGGWPAGGGAEFVLAGVDDHRGGFGDGQREDLDLALAGVAPERAVVLLAHDPATFKRASGRGIDFQLSGHTHGGQIWPFRYLVRLAVPFVAGRYTRGDAELYVSRGTGFWGPPMRLFAPAEITEITLRARR